MNLSDNLKKIRKDNNMSQEQLAEKLNVSRQSVSKWESGQAYPEMDKMIQLCQIFNLNIDELLNQDIREVNSTKQSKININKYIDDFLAYVSKTINMFCDMSFTTKIKCIFEQFMLIILFLIIAKILGGAFLTIIEDLFRLIPKNAYYFIYAILKIAYIIITLILGIILILYIFKIRYLDYYSVPDNRKNVPKQNKIENQNDNNTGNEKETIKKEDKIIIRDPEHSEYKFISSLLKLFVLLLRVFAIFIAIMFCFSFITLTVFTVLSFIFIKTGTIFVGGLILLIASLIINIIILIVLYNFIFSKKSKKNRLAITFIISLFAIGCGIGIISIGLTQFELVNNYDLSFFTEKEINVEMKDNLFIQVYNSIEYIESNNSNVKIVYKYSPYYEIETYNDGDGIFFYKQTDETKFMKLLNACIKDINNKKIYDYSSTKIQIYTTKENISKLKNNFNKYLSEE